MKVKIGDRIYDSDKEPVMIIISEQDKRNISMMPKGFHRYCSYPDDLEFTKNGHEKIKDWMEDIVIIPESAINPKYMGHMEKGARLSITREELLVMLGFVTLIALLLTIAGWLL